jgi:hypothetical protein
MLSLISPANVTPVRARSRTGAAFQGGCPAETRLRVIEMAAVRTAAADEVFARPRPRLQASTGATLFGNATHAAGQADSARQQRTSKKYTHTTRIAAAGGGALGPHPARDPV